MVELEKIDMAALKVAAKELNESGLLETKIKTTAVSKSDLVDAFLEAIENLDEDSFNSLNDFPLVVEMNNFILDDEGEAPEPEPEPVKTKSVKAEKPAKTEKPAKVEKADKAKPFKKVAAENKILTFREGSSGGEAEKLLMRANGASIAELKAVSGIPQKIIDWVRKHDFVVELHEGRYYYRADGKLKFGLPAKA